MHVCYNFSIIDEQDFQIPINDRAFQYGDGLFETMVYRNGHIRWINDHWQRLMHGCDTLLFKLPKELSPEYLEMAAQNLISKNRLSCPVRLKLIIWRKMGGLYTPQSNEINFIITTDVFTPNFNPINTIGISEKAKLAYSKLSELKTMSALTYVLAGLEKKEKHLDELIITDLAGNIAEGTSSNIFWEIGSKIYTPSLLTGCLAGVTRIKMISHFMNLGVEVREVQSDKKSLQMAETVFFTNVSGIRFLLEYENKNYTTENLHVKKFIEENFDI